MLGEVWSTDICRRRIKKGSRRSCLCIVVSLNLRGAPSVSIKALITNNLGHQTQHNCTSVKVDQGTRWTLRLDPAGGGDKQYVGLHADKPRREPCWCVCWFLYVTGDVFRWWIYICTQKLFKVIKYVMSWLQMKKLRMYGQSFYIFLFPVALWRQVCISHDVMKAIYRTSFAYCFR